MNANYYGTLKHSKSITIVLDCEIIINIILKYDLIVDVSRALQQNETTGAAVTLSKYFKVQTDKICIWLSTINLDMLVMSLDLGFLNLSI